MVSYILSVNPTNMAIYVMNILLNESSLGCYYVSSMVLSIGGEADSHEDNEPHLHRSLSRPL